jgi:hypothetical protein
LSFDTGASQQVQGDIASITSRLEALIGERDKAVASAMSDFQADGVSDEYAHVEQRWRSAAHEVRAIIALVRSTMAQNDGTAGTTLGRAKNAVASIG